MKKTCNCGAEFETRPGNKRTRCYKCQPRCTARTTFMKRPDGSNMSQVEKNAAITRLALEAKHAAVLVQVAL